MTPEQALQLGVQRAKAVSEGSKGQLLNALPEGWLSRESLRFLEESNSGSRPDRLCQVRH